MRQSLPKDTLETLISTQAVREFRCVRKAPGWALEGRLGGYWLPIRSRREPVRVWRSLTAVGRFCEGVGIRSMTVEL